MPAALIRASAQADLRSKLNREAVAVAKIQATALRADAGLQAKLAACSPQADFLCPDGQNERNDALRALHGTL